MTSYGFGQKSSDGTDNIPEMRASDGQRLDFTGIRRAPVTLDPAREEATIQRDDALGFVNRGTLADEGGRRRRRSMQPQINVFIKGAKDTLEWFIKHTNERGYRSYWQTVEEFRTLLEGEAASYQE